MITASNLVLTAASLFGLRVAGFAEPMTPGDDSAEPSFEADLAPSIDLLSPGEPYFEAVANELRRTGYLDS
jgi:hypothetical protein